MKSMKARLLPDDGDTCGWYNVLAAPAAPRVLHSDIDARWLVVGAGFSGMACARRLAELHPDDRIVVIEAQRVGQGNSGRNSGWLLNFNPFSVADAELRQVLGRLQQTGLDHLARIVGENGIECDWFPWGNLCFGLSDREQPELELAKTNCQVAGKPFEVWSAAKVKDLTGIKRTSEAFFQPGTVLVNPAALVRGLAKALPPNVELYENSPLIEIRKDGGYVADTRDGRVRADRVLLCANGFTPHIIGRMDRAVPIAAFSVLSRVLTDEELAVLGSGSPYAFISPVRGDALFRRTPDGRLMCRQNWIRHTPGRRFNADMYKTAETYARNAIRLRWPDLAAVELPFVWGGVVSMTRNYGGHFFGQIDDGIFATSFCNGAHNTKGTAAGMALADFASGLDTPLLADQLKVPQPAWLPPNPFLKLGIERTIRRMMTKQRQAYERLDA